MSMPGQAHEQEANRVAAEVTGVENSVGSAPTTAQPPDGPLPTSSRADLQARLGHDLGDVRVHTDAAAAAAANKLHARAFTIGHDVYFGAGQYAHGTSASNQLLIHELTHVVQQSGAAATDRGPAITHYTGPAIHRDATDDADTNPLTTTMGRLVKDAVTANAAGVVADVSQLAVMAQQLGSILAGVPFPVTDPAGGPSSVTAQFFPGRTSRKALIVGGVHNRTEPQGSDVVGKLALLLARRIAAGKPPFFTVILVQDLFAKSRYDPASPRSVQGGVGINLKGMVEPSRSVEPNRNFPLPGEGLAEAQHRGRVSPTSPELVFRDPTSPSSPPRAAHDTPGGGHGGTSTRLLPENRTLIGLIERTHPERIATVHAHSLQNVQGNAPGIFVDPRGMDPTTGTTTDPKLAAEDDRLASAMVRAGRARVSTIKHQPTDPFAGNIARGKLPASVHYAPSATHTEGNSLGQWAPTPVATGPGTRAGITTVTVELPQWNRAADAAALDHVEDLDAQLLAEIFLEDPAGTATGPSTP